MIYSVGENIYGFNSGVEFVQIKRTQSLLANGEAAKIVTQDYNRFLARDIINMGIENTQYINMYDYFQHANNIERQETSIRFLSTIPLRDYHVTSVNANYSTIDSMGRKLAKINVMPGTVGLVGDIVYYDRVGNKEITQYYDWRGFLSMEETYHPDGSVALQTFFDVNGKSVIEIVHMFINGVVTPTMYKLLNFYGQDYVFDTQVQLFTFFLNELNIAEPGIFVADRPGVVEAVLGVLNPVKTVAYLHENHLEKNQITDEKMLKQAYAGIVTPVGKHFDLIATATDAQTADLKQGYTGINACTLQSATYTSIDISKQTDLTKIVYVGRLAPDKNISGLIDIFQSIHEQKPDAELYLKGYYSSTDYKQQIEHQLHNTEIVDAVHFLDYSIDNRDIYQDAALFLTAAKSEGFGINALEGMSHGVPVACYAVDYINKNLVINGENGITITNRTPHNLAKLIVATFEDVNKIKKLKSNALKTAQKFDANRLVTQWRSIGKN
ncbi:glycosyltransferase [Periweissella fabaria]|uniref:UDP-N-acetylglucosamine--peptide N-acetylglucosaminyltransferase GtfA subunit n=1 Tax=Periweissella fabaria TaxID=546157 RepID=A0ABN8BIJ8_9LACO|nr:glycosyltransferase [Periweissella fabaria]MCM0597251.1 glycosyltransferase [Periweissella fabaria]CAH0416243.1 UDP-N-acetylglucosamine--peptide N-acetylglucosaminyltransferase GtfA subunit [Periweissella fabaria]